MSAYDDAKNALARRAPSQWLVTGAAGFIGSHLVETLLRCGQRVVALDNFATGHRANVDDVCARVGAAACKRLRFVEGDIRRLDVCREATHEADYVLHLAALGSVQRSIENPLLTHQTNVDGFVNMLVAAQASGVRRFVYASSSSVYGDRTELPNREEFVGTPLSPYAATKRCNEIYAETFHRTYGLSVVGIRYFNVFGARQASGPYAAVIPRWIARLVQNEPVQIHGAGDVTRDFTHVDNIVQMNLLAALATDPRAVNQVFNGAASVPRTLNDVLEILRRLLAPHFPHVAAARPVHEPPRPQQPSHTFADIGKARALLGYVPSHTLESGLEATVPYYLEAFTATAPVPHRDRARPEANATRQV